MQRLVFLMLPVLVIGCATLAQRKSVQVEVQDDGGGLSEPRVIPAQGGEVRVEVIKQVGDCMVQDFVVGPKGRPPSALPGERVEPRARSARPRRLCICGPRRTRQSLLGMCAPCSSTQAANTSLNKGGTPVARARRAWVAPLLDGYRFDHYEVATDVTGPGGASASVMEAPLRGSDQASLRIRWYYDAYSAVRFAWKIFATGPCLGNP